MGPDKTINCGGWFPGSSFSSSIKILDCFNRTRVASSRVEPFLLPLIASLLRGTIQNLYYIHMEDPFVSSFLCWLYWWELQSDRGKKLSASIISDIVAENIETLLSREQWPDSAISNSDHYPHKWHSVIISWNVKLLSNDPFQLYSVESSIHTKIIRLIDVIC